MINTIISDIPGQEWYYLVIFISVYLLFRLIIACFSFDKESDSAPLQRSSSTSIQSVQKKSTSKSTPAQKLCWLIWSETDDFVSKTNPHFSRKQYIYLWASFFYVAVKAVKDQAFIDEVYSHFSSFAIKRVRDPEHRAFMVANMRAEYRQIRTPLNESKINPLSESGAIKLWTFIKHSLYDGINPPVNAQAQYIQSVNLLKKMAVFYYLKSKESVSVTIPKYSISEPDEESELPNE